MLAGGRHLAGITPLLVPDDVDVAVGDHLVDDLVPHLATKRMIADDEAPGDHCQALPHLHFRLGERMTVEVICRAQEMVHQRVAPLVLAHLEGGFFLLAFLTRSPRV